MDTDPPFVDIFTGNTKEGKAFWALVSIPRENVSSYLHVSRSGMNFDLSQYGKVIKTGWGRSIPNDIAPIFLRHGSYLDMHSGIKADISKIPPGSNTRH